MVFRAFQGFSVAMMVSLWAVKMLMHPGRPHPMLLLLAVVLAVVSEISYRLGRADSQAAKSNPGSSSVKAD